LVARSLSGLNPRILALALRCSGIDLRDVDLIYSNSLAQTLRHRLNSLNPYNRRIPTSQEPSA
jgi:hypothetical protein